MQHFLSLKDHHVARFRLTLTARWGDQVLRPGDYSLHFCSNKLAPVVAIHGTDVAVMVSPTRISLCDRGRLSTLFLTPCAPPPQVQLLRLALAGVDLHFLEDPETYACPGLLALPLSEDVEARFSAR